MYFLLRKGLKKKNKNQLLNNRKGHKFENTLPPYYYSGASTQNFSAKVNLIAMHSIKTFPITKI